MGDTGGTYVGTYTFDPAVRVAPFTAENGVMYRCDVSGGTFIVSAPLNPIINTTFGVKLVGNGSANVLTVTAADQLHQYGVAATAASVDIPDDGSGRTVIFAFNGTDWDIDRIIGGDPIIVEDERTTDINIPGAETVVLSVVCPFDGWYFLNGNIRVRWIRSGGQNSAFVAKLFVNGVFVPPENNFVRKSADDYEEPFAFAKMVQIPNGVTVDIRFENTGQGSMEVLTDSRMQMALMRGN